MNSILLELFGKKDIDVYLNILLNKKTGNMSVNQNENLIES